MPKRFLPGGFVYHAMNRGARRAVLFHAPEDYRAFLKCLAETVSTRPMRLLAYCVMPNHFHLVCWPEADGDLPRFMQRLTGTHSRRWHAWRGTHGQGAVYQGRYRASMIRSDTHLFTVCRYVERNPIRAKLVARAEDWPWSSATQHGRNCEPVLTQWPIPKPFNWVHHLNAVDIHQDLQDLRGLLKAGRPVGDLAWQAEAAVKLGL